MEYLVHLENEVVVWGYQEGILYYPSPIGAGCLDLPPEEYLEEAWEHFKNSDVVERLI